MKNLLKILLLIFSLNLNGFEVDSNACLSSDNLGLALSVLIAIQDKIYSDQDDKELMEQLGDAVKQLYSNDQKQLTQLSQFLEELKKNKDLEKQASLIIDIIKKSQAQAHQVRFHDDYIVLHSTYYDNDEKEDDNREKFLNWYGKELHAQNKKISENQIEIDYLKMLQKRVLLDRSKVMLHGIIYALETGQQLSEKICNSMIPELKRDEAIDEDVIADISRIFQNNFFSSKCSKQIEYEIKKVQIKKAIEYLEIAKSKIDDEEMSQILKDIIIKIENCVLSEMDETLAILEAFKENEDIGFEISEAINIINGVMKTDTLINYYLE